MAARKDLFEIFFMATPDVLRNGLVGERLGRVGTESSEHARQFPGGAGKEKPPDASERGAVGGATGWHLLELLCRSAVKHDFAAAAPTENLLAWLGLAWLGLHDIFSPGGFLHFLESY
jgi:hypothetical protein